MDLNLFRVFDAIYRAGSLTEAAKDLHITQPAVSNSLARLREHFDDPLFERRGRGIEPTALAHNIAGDIAGALLTLQTSARRAQQFDPGTSKREFILSMPEAVELALLPELALNLISKAPGTHLQILPLPRSELSRKLANNEVSIAIDIPQRVDDSVAQQAVLRDEMCVLMRKDHPLAQDTLSEDQYLKAMHINASRRGRRAVFEDVELQRRGHNRHITLRGHSYHSACHIVAKTDLLLTLPRFLALHYQPLLPLHIMEVPFRLPPIKLMMYWHRGQERDAAHAWLRKQLQAHIDSVAKNMWHTQSRMLQP